MFLLLTLRRKMPTGCPAFILSHFSYKQPLLNGLIKKLGIIVTINTIKYYRKTNPNKLTNLLYETYLDELYALQKSVSLTIHYKDSSKDDHWMSSKAEIRTEEFVIHGDPLPYLNSITGIIVVFSERFNSTVTPC